MSIIFLFYSGMLESVRPIELEPLRLFLQVAATGSFSRAATLAASTQSAVSKRIGALERQLAVRLFERTGRGARLTRWRAARAEEADDAEGDGQREDAEHGAVVVGARGHGRFRSMVGLIGGHRPRAGRP